MPFCGLTDLQFIDLFNCHKQQWDDVIVNNSLREYMIKLYGNDVFQNLDCSYITPDHFNHTFTSKSNAVELSVFHVNIQCLNAKHRALCQLLESICIEFDVVVLSEIWSYNVEFYQNILPNYNFYYELPVDSHIGGVGIYVKKSLCQNTISSYKLINTKHYKVEDLWLEISVFNKKYIIGGIYRHPNQNITDFKFMLETTLSKISQQKHPCIIAGDLNIDLVQCDTQKATQDYLDVVTTNNFMPLLILPTRITSKSSTLIDHIYYYEGKLLKEPKIKCGNLLSDISDHLPNYFLKLTDKNISKTDRPTVRLFSEKNREKFINKLNLCDWSNIYASNDANITCNLFLDKIQQYFSESFPFVKLSRKRARDKKWITGGLKKSSRTKAKLYKAWLVNKTVETETKYKNYKKTFKKLALECETRYYRELFDKKNNSVRQLWKNLNTVCSFKGSNSTRSISRILSNGTEISNGMEICSELNHYFSTVGESN